MGTHQERSSAPTASHTKKPFRRVHQCVKSCEPEKSPHYIALASAKRGLFKYGFAFAGSNAYRVNKIVSVRELIDSSKAEYAAACNGSLVAATQSQPA